MAAMAGCDHFLLSNPPPSPSPDGPVVTPLTRERHVPYFPIDQASKHTGEACESCHQSSESFADVHLRVLSRPLGRPRGPATRECDRVQVRLRRVPFVSPDGRRGADLRPRPQREVLPDRNRQTCRAQLRGLPPGRRHQQDVHLHLLSSPRARRGGHSDTLSSPISSTNRRPVSTAIPPEVTPRSPFTITVPSSFRSKPANTPASPARVATTTRPMPRQSRACRAMPTRRTWRRRGTRTSPASSTARPPA